MPPRGEAQAQEKKSDPEQTEDRFRKDADRGKVMENRCRALRFQLSFLNQKHKPCNRRHPKGSEGHQREGRVCLHPGIGKEEFLTVSFRKEQCHNLYQEH